MTHVERARTVAAEARQLITCVCHTYGIEPKLLLSRQYRRDVVIVRCIVASAMHFRGFKLSEVARSMRRSDHTTARAWLTTATPSERDTGISFAVLLGPVVLHVSKDTPAAAPEVACDRCGLRGHESKDCDLRVENFLVRRDTSDRYPEGMKRGDGLLGGVE